MDYKMTVHYKNEEVDVFEVDFGVHDLPTVTALEINALLFEDGEGKEVSVFLDAVQKIEFEELDND